MREQKIPICMITDERYCFSTAVTLISLLENATPDTFYDIYCIVDSKVKEEDRNKIASICENYDNCSFKMFDVGEPYKNKPCRHKYVTNASLYKFLIPELLPDYDKVLYIDTDTLINKDLTELYSVELHNNYVGGVFSLYHYMKHSFVVNLLDIPDMSCFFNAGVMLMNLKLMRSDNLKQKLETYIGQFKGSVDQYIYNKVCYGRVKFLPCKFNVTQINFPIYKDRKQTQIVYSDREVLEAAEDPVIFHYTGFKKPWIYNNLPFSLRWYMYYMKSPYNNIPIELQEYKTEELIMKKSGFFLLVWIKRFSALTLNTFYLTHKLDGRSFWDFFISHNKNFSRFINIFRITEKDDLYVIKQRLLYTIKFFLPTEKQKSAKLPDAPKVILKNITAPPNQERKTKKVVYTCNIGSYDNFINPTFVNPEWDYVYFTDNMELLQLKRVGAWKIVYADYYDKNSASSAAFYKINPHVVLPDYDESLYLNANMDILNNEIFEYLDSFNTKILCTADKEYKSIYEQLDYLVKTGKYNFKDLMKFKELLVKSKFPKKSILFSDKFIYRHHNDSDVIKIADEWQKLLNDYNVQNTAVLSYLLNKNNYADIFAAGSIPPESAYRIYSHKNK